MPFTKIGRGKYRSPSGRTFTQKQVNLYYARGGSFPKSKKKTSRKKTTRRRRRG